MDKGEDGNQELVDVPDRLQKIEARRDRWKERALVAEARVVVLELALKLACGNWKRPRNALSKKADEFEARAEAAKKWLEWADGRYPDDSPGDVIAAEPDGTIILDDSITTWNPIRALAFVAARAEAAEAENKKLREALEWLASDEAWEVTPQYQKDGRYRFNTAKESVYATPWGFAREALGKDGNGQRNRRRLAIHEGTDPRPYTGTTESPRRSG